MSVSNLFLFKWPSGFWYIIYTLNGRRVWKSTKCTDKHEAGKTTGRGHEGKETRCKRKAQEGSAYCWQHA